MKKNMLLHLHEQYAANNNAKLSSTVSLIVGLLAVIGAYGYVFLHVDAKFGCTCYTHKFAFEGLFLTATAATIVLGILIYICMYQGFAQRKGQFIIYAIRCKYKLNIKSDNGKRIFPDTYHPFDKKGREIYQGLFGEFIIIFSTIQIIILLSVVYVLCIYEVSVFFIILYFVVFSIWVVFIIWGNIHFFNKYKQICDSYKEYKVDNNEKKTEINIVVNLNIPSNNYTN